MTTTRSAHETIAEVVATWPGVEIDTGELGETAFVVGTRELGHLHGDHAAHFSFPRSIWHELREEGRIVPHPVFPEATQGPAARPIRNDEDVRDVLALLRLNYERLRGRDPSGR